MNESTFQVTREWLDGEVSGCGDVALTEMRSNRGESGDSSLMTLIYCTGLIDRTSMQTLLFTTSDGKKEEILNNPLVSEFDPGENGLQLFNHVFSGRLVIWLQEDNRVYVCDTADNPGRAPEESTMEVSLKGPRDGFIEQIDVNCALIRKRLRTTKLQIESFIIGSSSQTQVQLLYLKDTACPEIIHEARGRLKRIHIEALQTAAELEEIISDRSLSLFPLVNYVGRPDFVVQSLLNGRFALLVDGSPSALIAPANLAMLIKSPEDAHLPYYFVSFERLLRLLGFLLAIALPGFWISLLAFNSDQVPLPLLATVIMSRMGLPLGSQMELFIMIMMFELFREAGVRLPRAVGQTVTVVGGLIVGDAAIRAGLTSPTMLVVSAVTAVATFTLVNQSLNGTVTVIRIYILFVSSILGLFGFFISLFSVFLYLCRLESFGQPYLAPVAPFKPRQLLTALLQLPWKFRAKQGD
ncbi:spore germination protein [Paenibacillus oenotherae]|uniref:spore germination protein n=1 Tax=Paenibacillus oenotherae TaxID=1435645 RepID=UPI0031BAA6EC